MGSLRLIADAKELPDLSTCSGWIVSQFECAAAQTMRPTHNERVYLIASLICICSECTATSAFCRWQGSACALGVFVEDAQGVAGPDHAAKEKLDCLRHGGLAANVIELLDYCVSCVAPDFDCLAVACRW
jgi:hypothetical protein